MDEAVGEVGELVGVGVAGGALDPPATILASMHEVNISFVFLHTHSHRNVTRPLDIVDGSVTVWG